MNNNRGLLGQYAGFFSRAVALFIDIVIVILLGIIVHVCIALPVEFFLGLDPSTCSSTRVVSLEIIDPRLVCTIANLIDLVFTVLVAPIYFTFFVATTGQTIGHYVMGVRVVRADGKRMTVWRSLVRWIGMIIDMIALGIGFVWVLIDDRRQGWHDKMAGTYVVYAWEARQNEYLLDRVSQWVTKGRKAINRVTGHEHVTPAPGSPGGNSFDLVTIAFQDYEQMDAILSQIQDNTIKGRIAIVNATVLVKGPQGDIGVLGASDLATGAKISQLSTDELRMPEYELQHVMGEVANDSFVIAVVLEEQWADQLTKIVARAVPSIIRRYDLGNAPVPARAAVRKAPLNPSPVAVTAVGATTTTPYIASSKAQPAAAEPWNTTAVAPPRVSPGQYTSTPPAAAPSAAIPSLKAAPVYVAAPPAPPANSVAPADSTSGDPSITWPALPTEPTFAAPSTSIAPQATAAQWPSASAPLASHGTNLPGLTPLEQASQLPAVEPVALAQPAPLPTTTVAAVQTMPDQVVTELESEVEQVKSQVSTLQQQLSAALSERTSVKATLDQNNAELAELKAQVAALQAAAARQPSGYKAVAIAAAIQFGHAGKTTTILQDLANVNHIGVTYEQRLYRAGVGTFWELAHVSDAEFERFLKLNDLQKATIKCNEIRSDALRLAESTNSVGLIWEGDTPDDFEPLQGIGRVYEQRLYEAGIRTYRALANTSVEELAAVCQVHKGPTPDFASWIEQARALQADASSPVV